MRKFHGGRFHLGRTLRFERLESRTLLSITITSNEVWDGVSNPHAADGVILTNGEYLIPTGINIAAGVTVRLDSTTPPPGDPPSNSITWTFAPGAGGLTFASASSTIDVHPGIRARSTVAQFTLNMNDNDIVGAVPGAGRIINGPFVTDGGNTGDAMSVVINSQADVILGAIDIGVNDATTGSITINAQGLVDVGRLSNADVNSGGSSTQPINVVGSALVLGSIDTRSFRPNGSVGDINLRALAQPADDPAAFNTNSANVNLITLKGAVTTNGPPTGQLGGSLTLTAAKVVLAPSFSASISELADMFVTVGAVQSGFTQTGLFVNSSAATPDKLSYIVFHDGIEPDLPGDGNGDGVVDAADYTVWRNSFESQSDLSGDYNRSGAVDSSDYQVWRKNFGQAYTPPIPPNSVTHFGATPDDGTVDNVAIQAALNSFGAIYFPAGEYWISSKVTVPDGKTLYGPASGPRAVIRMRHDTGTGGNHNDFATHSAIYVVGDNVTIENLSITKDFLDGSYALGIFADGTNNLKITGVEISNLSVRYGIFLDYSYDFEIRNVYIHDFLMNQSGVASDMVDSSPAGIRTLRSHNGVIRDSRIYNIDVGPNGRNSLSEVRQSYGIQGHQADGITITQSSHITVENNDIWNSGELIDDNTSEYTIIRDNRFQQAYLFGVKSIGSRYSAISGNYIADGYIGLWIGDRLVGEESTGNLIDNNVFVNNGSRGIWNIHPSQREQYHPANRATGLHVGNDASGNTFTNNTFYDYYGYSIDEIHEGTGSNTFANNQVIIGEYGPSGAGSAQILGSWTQGLSHAKELIAFNRALVFFTYAVDAGADIDATAVTYGGIGLSKLSARLVSAGDQRVYVSAWILRQDDINRAPNGNFAVTWNSAPDSVGYSSVFLANVYQPAPLFSEDTGGPASAHNVRTSPRPTKRGDIVLYGAVASGVGEFVPDNGFTEALEVTIPNADGASGYKLATGTDEAASTSHDDLGIGAVSMIVLADDNYLSPPNSAGRGAVHDTAFESIDTATNPKLLTAKTSGSSSCRPQVRSFADESVARFVSAQVDLLNELALSLSNIRRSRLDQGLNDVCVATSECLHRPLSTSLKRIQAGDSFLPHATTPLTSLSRRCCS